MLRNQFEQEGEMWKPKRGDCSGVQVNREKVDIEIENQKAKHEP
jgi:hypothetical protein